MTVLKHSGKHLKLNHIVQNEITKSFKLTFPLLEYTIVGCHKITTLSSLEHLCLPMKCQHFLGTQSSSQLPFIPHQCDKHRRGPVCPFHSRKTNV